MARIGFIGLGNMGAPMAACLARAGHQVTGFDLSPSALAGLAASGGAPAASARAAAEGAEVVITMLPAGQHVTGVLTGPDGILAHAAPDTLVIDCSTIDVGTARTLAQAAAQHGCSMLDAPVSGGTTGAAAGTLTFMVGGDPAAVTRAQPILAGMGRTIVHAGPSGAGQAAKLCNNLLLGITMLGVAEAFALADKLGLSAQSLFDISSTSSGQCWALTSYCPVPGPVPSAPSNRDYQAGFAAALMLKDLTLAMQAAADSGAPGVLGRHAQHAYAHLCELGLGDKDFSVAAKALQDGSIGS